MCKSSSNGEKAFKLTSDELSTHDKKPDGPPLVMHIYLGPQLSIPEPMITSFQEAFSVYISRIYLFDISTSNTDPYNQHLICCCFIEYN